MTKFVASMLFTQNFVAEPILLVGDTTISFAAGVTDKPCATVIVVGPPEATVAVPEFSVTQPVLMRTIGLLVLDPLLLTAAVPQWVEGPKLFPDTFVCCEALLDKFIPYRGLLADKPDVYTKLQPVMLIRESALPDKPVKMM